MSWQNIVSGLFGVAGGGWGSAAAVIGLLVGLWLIVRAWKRWRAEAAHKDTEDQAAKDQAGVIQGNATSEAQAKKDEQSAADALTHAGGAPRP